MFDTVVPRVLRKPSAEFFRPRIATASNRELDALDKLADKQIEANEYAGFMEGYATPEDRRDAWHTNKHYTKLERQLRTLMGPKQDLFEFSSQKQNKRTMQTEDIPKAERSSDVNPTLDDAPFKICTEELPKGWPNNPKLTVLKWTKKYPPQIPFYDLRKMLNDNCKEGNYKVMQSGDDLFIAIPSEKRMFLLEELKKLNW